MSDSKSAKKTVAELAALDFIKQHGCNSVIEFILRVHKSDEIKLKRTKASTARRYGIRVETLSHRLSRMCRVVWSKTKKARDDESFVKRMIITKRESE